MITSRQNAKLQEIEAVVSGLRAKYNMDSNMDGGYGSGNWGHRGRQGMRGGSAPGGGRQNRRELPMAGAGSDRHPGIKFTSFSKQRDAVAIKHQMSQEEFDSIPIGSVIKAGGKTYVKKNKSKYLTSNEDGKKISVAKLTQLKDTRIAVPKKSNTNVQKNRAIGTMQNEERRIRLEKYPKHETDEEAVARLEKGSRAAFSKMSKEEQEALKSYTGESRRIMNKKMERGFKNGKYGGQIQNAKKAVNGATLENDIRMSETMSDKSFMKRFGISEEVYLSAKSTDRAGDVLAGYEGKKRGFTSGKIGTEPTTKKQVVVHRNVKAGMKGIATSPIGVTEGNEVVLGTGTCEVITRSWMDGNTLHVETDVTNQDLD